MSSNSPDTRNQPGLRPTSPATLVVAALAAASVGWLLIANDYRDFPTVTWFPAFLLAGLAVLEFVAANTTKARIDRKPGAGPVQPLLVMRYVLLAKASSLAGAIFAGFFGAVTVWLVGSLGRLDHAGSDLPPAIGSLVGAILLLAGGLLLERACRVPPRPDDDKDDESS